MTIIDMNAWRAAREAEQLARINEQLDLQLAAIARARGMTVQALEQEELDEIDAQAEADPEFQLWRLSQQPADHCI